MRMIFSLFEPYRKRLPPRKTCPACMRVTVDEAGVDQCQDCEAEMQRVVAWERKERLPSTTVGCISEHDKLASDLFCGNIYTSSDSDPEDADGYILKTANEKGCEALAGKEPAASTKKGTRV